MTLLWLPVHNLVNTQNYLYTTDQVDIEYFYVSIRVADQLGLVQCEIINIFFQVIVVTLVEQDKRKVISSKLICLDHGRKQAKSRDKVLMQKGRLYLLFQMFETKLLLNPFAISSEN